MCRLDLVKGIQTNSLDCMHSTILVKGFQAKRLLYLLGKGTSNFKNHHILSMWT